MPAYKRILLKLSGEALMGDDAYGINRATIVRMVEEVAEIVGIPAGTVKTRLFHARKRLSPATTHDSCMRPRTTRHSRPSRTGMRRSHRPCASSAAGLAPSSSWVTWDQKRWISCVPRSF